MPPQLHSADRTPFLIVATVIGIMIVSRSTPATAAGWPYQTSRGPFVIHADFPLHDKATLLSELHKLQSDIQRQLRIGAAREPIHVYLFHDKNAYMRYMKHYFPHITPRRAMFIKSNSPGNVFAYDSPVLAVDLRHECTHALLHSCMTGLPLWLDEGLAEYYEVPAAARKTQNPHHDRMRPKLYWIKTPSLQRLENLASLDQMSAREYRESWAWVHFMLHGPSAANDVLLSFLRALQQGQPAASISQRLAAADLQTEFARHFRRRDLR